MKTTHLFKHDKQYYAKSTVTGVHVRYEYSFENTSKKELYPWYVWMEKPWGKESYEDAKWESPRGYGRSYLEDDTIGGWDEGPTGRFPTKKMMTFRQLKIENVEVVVTLENGHRLEYNVSNEEDKLFKHYQNRRASYDATNIQDIYRIYSETDRYRVGYHFNKEETHSGTNPHFVSMKTPLDQNCTRFDVMIDDAVDLYNLERVTLEKLVEEYAQAKLDNFVEENL